MTRTPNGDGKGAPQVNGRGPVRAPTSRVEHVRAQPDGRIVVRARCPVCGRPQLELPINAATRCRDCGVGLRYLSNHLIADVGQGGSTGGADGVGLSAGGNGAARGPVAPPGRWIGPVNAEPPERSAAPPARKAQAPENRAGARESGSTAESGPQGSPAGLDWVFAPPPSDGEDTVDLGMRPRADRPASS